MKKVKLKKIIITCFGYKYCSTSYKHKGSSSSFYKYERSFSANNVQIPKQTTTHASGSSSCTISVSR